MPPVFRPTTKRRVVGHSISDPQAADCLVTACRDAQLAVRSLPGGGVPDLPAALPFDLLVYDLGPGNAEAVAFVRQFTLDHPRHPVLLYRPFGAAAAGTAARLAGLPNVFTRVQCPHAAAEIADLEAMIEALLRDVPRRRLEDLTRLLLDPYRAEVAAFAQAGIAVLARQAAGSPSVREVRQAAGLSRKRMAAAFAPKTVPKPKTLLRCLTLTFAALEADWLGGPLAHGARRLGVNEKALSRLRHDYLPADLDGPRVTPGLVLDYAIEALTTMSGWSREWAREVVRDVAPARPAPVPTDAAPQFTDAMQGRGRSGRTRHGALSRG